MQSLEKLRAKGCSPYIVILIQSISQKKKKKIRDSVFFKFYNANQIIIRITFVKRKKKIQNSNKLKTSKKLLFIKKS